MLRDACEGVFGSTDGFVTYLTVVQGYALIEYETHKEAQQAIENMNGTELLESTLACDWAFSRGAIANKSSRRRSLFAQSQCI